MTKGFPSGTRGKEHICPCRRHWRRGFGLWIRKIPRRRAWQPTPVFLPGESQGQRSLAGHSPWSCKELDMTEATDYTLMHTPQKLIQHCKAMTFQF